MVAVVATLAAVAALGRDAFVALPDVKPITAMTLVVGYALAQARPRGAGRGAAPAPAGRRAAAAAVGPGRLAGPPRTARHPASPQPRGRDDRRGRARGPRWTRAKPTRARTSHPRRATS